jgi:hypothetical protein
LLQLGVVRMHVLGFILCDLEGFKQSPIFDVVAMPRQVSNSRKAFSECDPGNRLR